MNGIDEGFFQKLHGNVGKLAIQKRLSLITILKVCTSELPSNPVTVKEDAGYNYFSIFIEGLVLQILKSL